MTFNLRRRGISPGACFDEELHALGDRSWRLFVSLPMVADRDGRLDDRPARLKAQLFPFHDISSETLDAMLDDLQHIGKLQRYEVDGRPLIQLLKWPEHQSPHHKEVESTLPPPETAWESGSPKHEPCIDHAQTVHEPTIPPITEAVTEAITIEDEDARAPAVESALAIFVESWPNEKLSEYTLRLVLERIADSIDLGVLRANIRTYLASRNDQWPRYVAKAHEWVAEPSNLRPAKGPPKPPRESPDAYLEKCAARGDHRAIEALAKRRTAA